MYALRNEKEYAMNNAVASVEKEGYIISENEKSLLSVLNDQKLKSISRVGTMVSLGFGDLVKNKVVQKTEEGNFITKEVFVPQYALHIDCSFRIKCGNSIMMSQRDMFCPNSEMIKSANFNEDEFEWDIIGNNSFDEKAQKHFVDTGLDFTIKKININSCGDLKILLSNDFSIEVFVDSSEKEECWRFFEVGNADGTHLVVSGDVLYEE